MFSFCSHDIRLGKVRLGWVGSGKMSGLVCPYVRLGKMSGLVCGLIMLGYVMLG
jgi:hypothetical protein